VRDWYPKERKGKQEKDQENSQHETQIQRLYDTVREERENFATQIGELKINGDRILLVLD